jgi:hypothetical protein
MSARTRQGAIERSIQQSIDKKQTVENKKVPLLVIKDLQHKLKTDVMNKTVSGEMPQSNINNLRLSARNTMNVKQILNKSKRQVPRLPPPLLGKSMGHGLTKPFTTLNSPTEALSPA